MAYKPKVISSGGGGIYGNAKIFMSPDKKKVKVVIQDKDGKESKFVLSASDCPKVVRSGEFSVALSKDGKKMYSLYPLDGMFTGKFVRIQAREGEVPVPQSFQSSEGGWGYLHWTPIVVITSPKEFAGMEVPFRRMRYHFDAVDEEIRGKTYQVVGINHQQSKYTAILVDFLDATGVWDNGPMKFSANILPDLQKRMSQADKSFQFVLKDGWVSTVFSMEQPEEEVVPDEEEEDEFSSVPDVETDPDEIPWD